MPVTEFPMALPRFASRLVGFILHRKRLLASQALFSDSYIGAGWLFVLAGASVMAPIQVTL
jgi:hypothetical protein